MGLITARSRCINYGHGGRDLINQLRNSVTEDGTPPLPSPPDLVVCATKMYHALGNSAIRLDGVSYPSFKLFRRLDFNRVKDKNFEMIIRNWIVDTSLRVRFNLV